MFPLMLPTSRWLKSFPTLVVSFTLVACGGGDGSSSSAVFTSAQTDTALQSTNAQVSISLAAGSIGGPGSLDGTGAAARFYDPNGIAIDAAGNLFIADTQNNTIRKVTQDGVVRTVAGTAGEFGATDGQGANARFSNPSGIVTDIAGNLYVADRLNHAIRRVTPTGVVTTLAGTPAVSGSTDGNGTAARFNGPSGIAIDAAGNLYVADTDNVTIRKLTPAGDVTTIAGLAGDSGTVDGVGGTARFNGPSSITIDRSGNLFVTDTVHFPSSHPALDNSTIRKITPSGVVSTLAGSSTATGSADGVGTLALFFYPGGITTDSTGTLYVSDTWNHTIRQIASNGTVSTIAGMAGLPGSTDGVSGAARFFYPSGIVSDGAGNLFLADSSNSTIRKIAADRSVTTLAGLASQSGSEDGTADAARFDAPYGIAADSAGKLYVADAANATIRKIDGSMVTTLAGSADAFGTADGPGATARFGAPHGIVSDAAGNLFVTDAASHTIRKINASGMVSTYAGQPDNSGTVDGPAATASFNAPNGIARDGDGNLYIADTDNHLVRKVSAAGNVTTLAGAAGVAGNADGVGTAARFSSPQGIAVDRSGNVFVADTNNHSLRKIAPDGTVTTLAGSGVAGFGDGLGSIAQFNYPQALAIDASGNVYVADTLNEAIRKVTPQGLVSTAAGVAGRRGIVLGTLPGGLSRPFGITFVSTGTFAVTSGNSVLLLQIP